MDSDPTAPFAERMLQAILTYAESLDQARDMIRLAQTIDRDALAALQRKYAEPIVREPRDGPCKFIDVAHWIGIKYPVAAKLGLLGRPVRSILDIGTGAGHFVAIAQYYGHKAIGIDIEYPLYSDLAELLGVTRVIRGVYRQTPLPSLGRKFDLITALLISFNALVHDIPRQYWDIADWEFFVNDLIANHLRVPGRIYLTLNQNQADDGSFYNDIKLIKWFKRHGAIVNNGEIDIRVRQRAPFGQHAGEAAGWRKPRVLAWPPWRRPAAAKRAP